MKLKWENVKRKHIIKAIKLFESGSVSPTKSKSTFLLHNNKEYPAKFIRGLAYEIANRKMLDKDDYSGGIETIRFFERLGFQVKYTKEKTIDVKPENNQKEQKQKTASRNVVSQKNALQILLQKQFGTIETEKNFEWLKTPNLNDLPLEYKIIYSKLKKYRNQNKIFKPNIKLQCDMYFKEAGLIIEYDERQHFSEARKITLLNYPSNIKLNFSKKDWIETCEKFQAKDNYPENRDENRAFYDCVRDIESQKNGYVLIRIKHGDYDWESDDAEIYIDKIFSKFKSYTRKINNQELRSVKIARLVIAGKWEGSLIHARKILLHELEHWPVGLKADFLITCGGFLQFNWPKDIKFNGNTIQPPEDVVQNLKKVSREYLLKFLSKDIIKKLSNKIKVITIGLDIRDHKNNKYIEFVWVYDITNNSYYCTGKSYPTKGQEHDLLRITNLKSHFIKLLNHRIMVLGCHDLKIFDPRARAVSKYWRNRESKKFSKMAKDFKPDIVLQHPHTTDSVLIWRNAWRTLMKENISIKHYAGAGLYYNNNNKVRSPLRDVLENTRHGDVCDIVVHANKLIRK